MSEPTRQNELILIIKKKTRRNCLIHLGNTHAFTKLNTVKHSYNELPGTAILLRYKCISLYPSSLQHII